MTENNNAIPFKQVIDEVKVFSCGINTKGKDMAKTNMSLPSDNINNMTAFPVLKLVTGGVSSRFFGVIPASKNTKEA